jgi:DNA-binding HxlR family transcriptional regulator
MTTESNQPGPADSDRPRTSESDQSGASVLRLLAEKSTLQVLHELSDSPVRPSELEQRLPDLPHSALMRRLGELALTGAVTHERIVDTPPRAYYSLTDAGEALLQIAEASGRWGQRWPTEAHRCDPEAMALRLLADGHTRTILRALAARPLRPTDLHRLLSPGKSVLYRRLQSLLVNGILARREHRGEVRYALTGDAHRLGFVALLAARWERRWATAEDRGRYNRTTLGSTPAPRVTPRRSTSSRARRATAS